MSLVLTDPFRFGSPFESLYLSFRPLTDVAKMHVNEYFSGDPQLNATWTASQISGSNSLGIADGLDGGFSITTAVLTNARASINFNNFNQYTHNSSVFIAVAKNTSALTNDETNTGLSSTNDIFTAATGQNVFARFSASVVIRLGSSDGTTFSTDDAITLSGNTYRGIHIETGTANLKLKVNGGLEVTKTTDRPSVALQPIFHVRASAAVASRGQIHYLEVFNL